MKTIIPLQTVLLICLSAFTLSAQTWTQVGYMVVGSDTASGGSMIRGYGSDVYAATTLGLFRSSDNGDSWDNISYTASATVGQEIGCVFITSTDDLYAGSDERLYRSTDNGATWSWVSTLPDSLTWRDVTEINGNLVASYRVSFSTGGAYYSTDDGASWTPCAGLPNLVMGRFAVVGDSLFLGGKNGVYLSTDDGASWTGPAPSSSAIGGIWDVVYHGGALFGGDVGGGGLFASYDEGANWDNADTTQFHPFCQVFSLTEGSGMILAAMDGAGNCKQIKMSADTGVTWTAFMSGLTAGFYPVVGRNATATSFFTKKGKEVFRYDLITSTQDAHAQKITAVVYPNPMNETATIRAEGTEARLHLQVYDVWGREVLSKEMLHGSTKISREALGAGVYLYRVSGEGRVGTGKIVVN